MHFILEQIQGNPVFSGIVGAMFTGSILYLLRAIPSRTWDLIERLVSVRLVVRSHDDMFEWVDSWLTKLDYARRATVLRFESREHDGKWDLSPGEGRHLIRTEFGFMMVKRSLDENPKTIGWSARPTESITFVTLGPSQRALRSLVEAAQRVKNQSDSSVVRIWADDWWSKLKSKNTRELSSVMIPAAQKDTLVSRCEWFAANRDRKSVV